MGIRSVLVEGFDGVFGGGTVGADDDADENYEVDHQHAEDCQRHALRYVLRIVGEPTFSADPAKNSPT